MLILKIVGIILTVFLTFAIILTCYAIAGVKYLEEVNQAREDAKHKRDMKQDLIDAINKLETFDKATVLDLIDFHIYERTKTQVYAISDDTVPLSLGVFEDITEFRIPIKLFKEDVTIEFEDECV